VETAAGPTGACGVGAGGIDRPGRIPYAEQASFEIDQQIGKSFTMTVGYLFVGAHKLVRGNNINVPCPVGTSKPGNPLYSQGILNPNGSLSQCQGTPTAGPFGLGPFFNSIPNFPAAGAAGACPNPWQTPIAVPGTVSPTGFACPGNPSGLEFGVPYGPPGAGFPAGPPTLSAGLLDFNNNVVNAAYHSLNVTAIERLGHYFALTANYTYSHSIDNGNFTTFINLPVNQFDYNMERANSNQDVRHRFVANLTASAPDHGWYRQFSTSSIITLQSGRPFTLFAGEDVFGDIAGLSTDRVGGAPLTPVCTSTGNCSTVIGRNTYVGDPLYSWDFRLARYFKLTERVRLDLAVDAFNFLNRPNVDEVTSVYGSPVFCGATPRVPRHYNDGLTKAIRAGTVSCASQITQSFGSGVFAFPGGGFVQDGLIPPSIPSTPNPNFGLPRTVLNPRQFQFSARFSF
jgi:hypothetical protein